MREEGSSNDYLEKMKARMRGVPTQGSGKRKALEINEDVQNADAIIMQSAERKKQVVSPKGSTQSSQGKRGSGIQLRRRYDAALRQEQDKLNEIRHEREHLEQRLHDAASGGGDAKH